MRLTLLAALATLLALPSLATAGGQVVLEPVKDNNLLEDAGGGLSNGAGDFFIAGRAGATAPAQHKRALIEFDVAGAVPPGATVTDATLTLHMRKTSSGAQTVELRRALLEWGEGTSIAFGGPGAPATPGDATWIHTVSPGGFWANVGGDFSTTLSATQSVDPVGFYSWSADQVTADVQDMLDDPGGNHGWGLIGNEAMPSTTKLFSSREWAEPAERPKLTIEYTVPAATYCTAGTSASGCQASITASGTASATAASGFVVSASGVEGAMDGMFFYGTNGRQAVSWGNGTSYMCVAPPRRRAGLFTGSGTAGNCDGSFTQDLNARWCPSCPKWFHNPGAGTVLQAQLWYRDVQNTSSMTTSLSDAVEVLVCP